jgi:hypothetical protein
MANLTITAANVIKGSGAVTTTGTAGETITAGQALYLKDADARLWLAQCDGTAEEAEFEGIALHAALAGQPVTYQTGGTMNIGATTVKGIYALSATPGGIAPLADLIATNRIVYVGYATTTTGTFVVSKLLTGAVV